MSTVINTLPPLKWRGIEVPCSSIETSFSHRQNPIEWAYVDVDGHDWTGLRGAQVSATLHFLTTIDPELYPGKWADFRAALIDGSSGPLEHPDFGEITARPSDVSYRITAQVLSGITVQASWIQSRDQVDEVVDFADPAADVAAAAEAAAEAMEELGLEYPDGTSETDIVGAIEQVQGFVFSAGQTIGGAVNQINGTIDRIREGHERAVEAVRYADEAVRDAVAGNPARHALETALIILQDGVGLVAEKALQKARPIEESILSTTSTLSSAAAQLGNTVDELLALNPAAAAGPMLPKGLVMKFYGKT